MKLYGMGKSRWLRPLWVLNELGVPFERVQVNLMGGEHQSPEYLKVNPMGKVPALQDGDLVLFESAAICIHLAEKYPDRGLLPEPGSRERALHHQWVFFCVTELEQPLWRMARHRFVYPEERRLPQDIDLAREDFLKAAGVLDEAMAGREFVVGNRFTVADALIGYTLVWASWENLLRGFPNLERYVEGLRRRSAFPEELKEPPVFA